ncbi:single-stranded-DNA-specific exonuclease RecJ [Baaleninema simplex]|uniref:single-stranded-DNA-specific exonuclease RecJ n=1 Tax=Baaleninema simplex TaxID=2862350 RepID=UPI000346BD08|nr:single-stranded-DNA-specific exonuclease RecJ [Baaleninema simplex]
MSAPPKIWHRIPNEAPPPEFVRSLQKYTVGRCERLAVLLWNRSVRDPEALPGFLDPKQYRSTDPFEFATEIRRAVRRLREARSRNERVAIWGDFDADGVTATSVLWEGLGQFFDRDRQLSYFVPNRFTDSHGLNRRGIQRLADEKVDLIVTCDTGSTNLEEIQFAAELGIDVIVTDHHTLPEHRPPVEAIVNPRNLPETHPLYHLSGVAVAYKLVEALYQTLPDIPQQPLEDLLDLVAIGLIADLVELSGDCRYLAQVGLEKLQQQLTHPTRPGVAELLKRCKRSGDRPSDVSFGIGPRINAVSRIHGDASFCIELLTSRDVRRCQKFAQDAELANTRRQELQRRVNDSVRAKLAQLDLSTTSVIVLSDPQWEVGVLGLVAGQIAQDYGRPTILLRTETTGEPPMARGSARSVDRIDLYRLVKSQDRLLHRFGGHPFAAGLSLPVSNLDLFAEAINRELAQQLGRTGGVASQQRIDLTVTVAELGRELFKELKYLEPCGMGNPVPQLLVRDCWFEDVWNKNLRDSTGKTVKYIRTFFKIWDETAETGFPGVWWGHYQNEVPKGRCDAVVELDFNAYEKRYEVRLIDVRSALERQAAEIVGTPEFRLLDWRVKAEIPQPHPPLLETCPSSWEQLERWFHKVRQEVGSTGEFALAYSEPEAVLPEEIFMQLVGIAKYLNRTQKWVETAKIRDKLGLSDRTLALGFLMLNQIGFRAIARGNTVAIWQPKPLEDIPRNSKAIDRFLDAIHEEQFRRSYFAKASISIVRDVVAL